MSPLPSNPFAVLSFIVAPAVLTNASSILILSTSTRLARAVDRARELSRELEASPGAGAEAKNAQCLRELTVAEERSVLLVRALRTFYLAIGGFAAATLLSLSGAVLAESAPAWVATLLGYVVIAAGLAAVGSVIFGAVLLVRETRMAVAILSEQTESLRFRVTHRGAKA